MRHLAILSMVAHNRWLREVEWPRRQCQAMLHHGLPGPFRVMTHHGITEGSTKITEADSMQFQADDGRMMVWNQKSKQYDAYEASTRSSTARYTTVEAA